ncbi:Fc.00g031880.m01.CDS01 [Cosmosporella sp. VM-42]
MKFSTTLALALAPLALARRVKNIYPPRNAEPGNHHDLMSEEMNDDGNNKMDDGNGRSKKGNNNNNNNYNDNSNSRTEIIIIWANPGNGAETTTINEKVTVTQTVTAGAGATTVVGDGGAITTIADGATATAVAPGASHTVTVGGPAGLVYTPDQLNNVPVGDTVVFEFLSMNHTVTQSPFDTPCDALPDGMDSGFMANPNNTVSPPPQIAMQVMVATPLWFYCKQNGHCGKGMVFSINPTAEKTQAMFQQKAIEQKGDGKSTPITGGDGTADAPANSAPAATSSAAAEAPPSATSVASAPEGTGAAGSDTPGQGTINPDGSCTCFVACAAGSFPAIEAQGLGNFGGQSGSLALNMGAMS